MNILVLNSSDVWGGTEKWACMAAHALAAEHDVSFAFAADVVGDRVEVAKHPMAFRSFFDIVTVLEIVRLIRRKRIQVLIPTKKTEYVLAGVAARLCGAVNVLRLGIVRDLRNRLHNNVIYNVLADGIIVNARPIKEMLLRSRFMHDERIRVIYNGLDTERLDAALESPRQRNKPFAFTVTTMGRLTRAKGVDFLLRAFARFLRESGARERRPGTRRRESSPRTTRLRTPGDRSRSGWSGRHPGRKRLGSLGHLAHKSHRGGGR